MKVFLVRHGTTFAGGEVKYQSPDSPLSKKGLVQTKELANRFKNRKIDVILASKWSRARGTAEVIAEALKIPLEFFEGIHEREQHPELYGVKWTSKIHEENVAEISANLGNLDWKFRGQGESIRDVTKRAIKFNKHLIKKHLGQNLLVVSHGIFIRCFVTICFLGENYKDNAFIDIHKSLYIDNTGISLIEYEDERKLWKVRYLNDHAHLDKYERSR